MGGSICGWTCAWIAGLLCVSTAVRAADGDELATREAVNAEARALLARDRFAEIEKVSSAYNDGSVRTSSGLWKGGIFLSGLATALQDGMDPPSEAEAQTIDRRLDEWAATVPDSPLVPLLRAEISLARAWRIRGGSYASRVPKERWAPFRERVASARAALQASQGIAARNPPITG